MKMESCIATIGHFLKMKKNADSDLDASSERYVIPKYQREYKWDEERVRTFLIDINNRDKFIGNFILNKVDDYYEIVDGQQRITTVLLILVALYNIRRTTNNDSPNEEQKEILSYLLKNGKVVLSNESIGDYLRFQPTSISLDIKEESDIYYQKPTFENLYSVIKQQIEAFADKSPLAVALTSFQKKLLDCQVLILIGSSGERQNESVEEIFLDINFKSQLLDVADIFKGYCFRNYYSNNHEELKRQWTEIRKNTKSFEQFGYEDTKRTSAYLYLYLLSVPSGFGIPENLSPNGRHFLEDYTNTDTKNLLQEMDQYGKNVISFSNHIKNSDYYFEDICADSKKHKEEISNCSVMKKMSRDIIFYYDAQYFKLPFFMFVHKLMSKETALSNELSFKDLKKFLSNYYVYSFLFILRKREKNKQLINRKILELLSGAEKDNSAIVAGILKETKRLRSELVREYDQFESFKARNALVLYSITDFYDANSNFLTKVYSSDHNQEHLIIHDNKGAQITWQDEGSKVVLNLKCLLGKDIHGNEVSNTYKKKTANYMIMPKDLNEDLGQLDIISKISIIKEYYKHTGLPKHNHLFIEFIEKLPTYKNLISCKGKACDTETIETKYVKFVREYFNENSLKELYDQIEGLFKGSFENH